MVLRTAMYSQYEDTAGCVEFTSRDTDATDSAAVGCQIADCIRGVGAPRGIACLAHAVVHYDNQESEEDSMFIAEVDDLAAAAQALIDKWTKFDAELQQKVAGMD